MTNDNYYIEEPQEENSRLDNMDYARLLHNVLHYWWIFAICMAISMSIAWFINKTSTPIYKAGTTILLKEASRNSQQLYELTQGFGLSGEQSNLENQKYIYTSPKMIHQAIKGKNYEITYIHKGRLLDTEIYDAESPFYVTFDSLHSQPIGANFEVTYISPKKVKMHVTGQQIFGYDFTTEDFTDFYAADVDTTFTIDLGQNITNKMFSMTLNPQSYVSREKYTYTTFFHFNTIQDLVSQWQHCVDFNVTTDGGTVAHITAIGTNQRKVMTFLRDLNNASVEYNLNKKNETATRTLSFIKTQLRQTADSLAAATERLKLFKLNHGFASRKEYASDLDKRYFTYDQEVRDMVLRRENLHLLNQKLTDGGNIEDYFSVATFNDNPLIQKQVSELITIQQTLNSIRVQTIQNPYKKEVVEQETLVKKNLQTIVNQTIANYDQTIAELKRQMTKLVNESGQIPDMETQALNLERDYNIQDAVYTFLLQKESETLIAKASNTADNEVLQDPISLGRISPDTRKNNTTAAALGFLIPAIIFFLIEFANNKIRSLKELKKTVPGLSVVGIIPQEDNCDDIPTISIPQSAISESFRTLRTKLKFISTEKDIHVITVSSCNPGEGKTFCSINIAISFAQAGKKCLLMNYDLRRPRAEQALGITNAKGITDHLVDSIPLEELIIKTHIDNLDVLPSGTIPPNPSELITSEKNMELINEVKSMYDVIIMDTAPVGCVADGRVLQKESDIFLFVVKAGKTEYSHLHEIIESLKEEKGNNALSLLFNGAKHSKRDYYRYGNYYGYGNAQ